MSPDGKSAVTAAVGDGSHHGGPSIAPVLQLKGIGKTYRRGDEEVHVLVDLDFTLNAGEFVVVTGPSGTGKSSFLHIAGGLDEPDSGAVSVGQPGRVVDEHRRARSVPAGNLGFVFQFFNLVPMLTAVENVSLPLVLDGVPARSAMPALRSYWNGSGWAIGRSTDRPNFRADKCKGWRWRARWWPGRRSFSPTSRPAIWTAIHRPRSWTCCGHCQTSTARPS